jgi:hypothetical protein
MRLKPPGLWWAQANAMYVQLEGCWCSTFYCVRMVCARDALCPTIHSGVKNASKGLVVCALRNGVVHLPSA